MQLKLYQKSWIALIEAKDIITGSRRADLLIRSGKRILFEIKSEVVLANDGILT